MPALTIPRPLPNIAPKKKHGTFSMVTNTTDQLDHRSLTHTTDSTG